MKYLILPFLIFLSLLGKAQTYTPSAHVPVNKALGIAQATPTDARSYYYDAGTFTYRPYNNTTEVLLYLNTTTKRTGNFPIYVNIGGIRKLYMFLNGTSDGDLKEIVMLQPSDTTRLVAIDSLQVLTDSTFRTRKNGVWTSYTLRGAGGSSGMTALTGDVTASGTGSVAATIANNAVTTSKIADANVTYPKLPSIAQGVFLGRATAGSGNTEALSAAQATSLLNPFTSVLQGLVPASGGGTTNFLRADGTWAAPPGGGGGSSSLQAALAIGNQKSTTIIDTAGTALNRTGWQGIPANYGTSYGSYGTASQFGSLGWQQFNGVNPSGRPNVVGMFWGYNTNPDASRINTGDGAFRFGTETHYETGPEKLFELHLPEFIDTAGVYHRLFSSYLDKTGKRANLWQSEGDGIQFNKWGDQNTAYANIGPARLTTYHYKKNQPWPYIEIGALSSVDSVNNVPWATKWNFKIENQKNEIAIGRTSAVAADLAAIRFYDRIYIGQTGTSGRRYMETYGNVFHAEGNLVVDQLSGSGSAFLAKVNGSTKFEVGESFTYTYNTIYALGNALHTVGSVSGTVGGNSLVSTIFEANSSSKSAMLPVLTTTARNSLSVPQTAMIHYNSDSSNFEFRDGTGFKTFASREWVRANFGAGGTPGGSNTQVQFNNSGAFGGSANFTWTNASNALGLGNSGTTAYLNIAAGTTSKALFNFGTGAAPTSPSAGDFWFDVADSSFKYRIGSNSLKWLYSKDQVVSTGLLLKPGAGTVADTLGVGGGAAGQVLVSNGSTSFATWTDLPAFTEGTYTATITNVTNVGTSSITTANYVRRGSYIEVFGEITIDPTATGDTHLRITLPVSSAISNTYDLSGQATTYDNNQAIRIYGDTTNSAAIFRLNASVDAASHVYSFRFIYKYTAP